MEKKVVLIVLIVVAVVAFMFLGAGLLRDDGEPELKAQDYKPGTIMRKMDSLFARSRKPFDRTRMDIRSDNCTLSPEAVLAWTGDCPIVIRPSKTKSSAFLLKRRTDGVKACYALSSQALRERCGNPDNYGELEKDKHRFVVTKDSAFLRLRCTKPANAQCSLIVE